MSCYYVQYDLCLHFLSVCQPVGAVSPCPPACVPTQGTNAVSSPLSAVGARVASPLAGLCNVVVQAPPCFSCTHWLAFFVRRRPLGVIPLWGGSHSEPPGRGTSFVPAINPSTLYHFYLTYCRSWRYDPGIDPSPLPCLLIY